MEANVHCTSALEHGGYIVTTLKTVTETAADVKESVQEFARSAGRKIDEAREGTGSALHAVASSVRNGSAAIDSVAAGAAKKLDATGSFVENWELRDVFNGLRNFGRSHLAGTVMVAAAAGFLAGSALRRAAHSAERTVETK
jgi:ElaB/YqjD/DUF883 family membrane-anchored ribosome-binding protein